MTDQEMALCARVIEGQLDAAAPMAQAIERDPDLDHYFSVLAVICGLMKLGRRDLLEDLFDHALMLKELADADNQSSYFADLGGEG